MFFHGFYSILLRAEPRYESVDVRRDNDDRGREEKPRRDYREVIFLWKMEWNARLFLFKFDRGNAALKSRRSLVKDSENRYRGQTAITIRIITIRRDAGFWRLAMRAVPTS